MPFKKQQRSWAAGFARNPLRGGARRYRRGAAAAPYASPQGPSQFPHPEQSQGKPLRAQDILNYVGSHSSHGG